MYQPRRTVAVLPPRAGTVGRMLNARTEFNIWSERSGNEGNNPDLNRRHADPESSVQYCPCPIWWHTFELFGPIAKKLLADDSELDFEVVDQLS